MYAQARVEGSYSLYATNGIPIRMSDLFAVVVGKYQRSGTIVSPQWYDCTSALVQLYQNSADEMVQEGHR